MFKISYQNKTISFLSQSLVGDSLSSGSLRGGGQNAQLKDSELIYQIFNNFINDEQSDDFVIRRPSLNNLPGAPKTSRTSMTKQQIALNILSNNIKSFTPEETLLAIWLLFHYFTFSGSAFLPRTFQNSLAAFNGKNYMNCEINHQKNLFNEYFFMNPRQTTWGMRSLSELRYREYETCS